MPGSTEHIATFCHQGSPKHGCLNSQSSPSRKHVVAINLHHVRPGAVLVRGPSSRLSTNHQSLIVNLANSREARRPSTRVLPVEGQICSGICSGTPLPTDLACLPPRSPDYIRHALLHVVHSQDTLLIATAVVASLSCGRPAALCLPPGLGVSAATSGKELLSTLLQSPRGLPCRCHSGLAAMLLLVECGRNQVGGWRDQVPRHCTGVHKDHSASEANCPCLPICSGCFMSPKRIWNATS